MRLPILFLALFLCACATQPPPPTAAAPDPALAQAATAFTTEIARRFRTADPTGWTIREDGPLALTLLPGAGQDSRFAALDRIFRVCLADEANCGRFTDEFVTRSIAAVAEAATPVRIAALRTIIRPQAYADDLRRMTNNQIPVFAPFLPGLVRVLVADTPSAMRPLAPADLAPLGLTEAQAFDHGTRNVAAELGPLPPLDRPAGPTAVLVKAGNAYESSRLLDPAAWAALAQARGGTLLVAIPSAETVLIGRGDTPAARAAFASALAGSYFKAQRPISDKAWRWTGTGWEELDLRPRVWG